MALSNAVDAGSTGEKMDEARAFARRHVRHFLADFAVLEERYPGVYPRLISRAEGAYLYDDAGRRLLDAGNHLGAGMIGHGRQELAERMAEQTRTLEFAALDSGVSHVKVAELAERLAPLVPIADPVFSFTSSGSESNDLAFKFQSSSFRRIFRPRFFSDFDWLNRSGCGQRKADDAQDRGDEPDHVDSARGWCG